MRNSVYMPPYRFRKLAVFRGFYRENIPIADRHDKRNTFTN